MNLHIKTFRSLSKSELYEILRLRAEVFVIEQNCPCLDPDGEDPNALHIWFSDGGRIVAYVRAFAAGAVCPEAKIGRVVTVAERRGEGLGARVMQAAVSALESRYGPAPILVEAQTYAEGFYEKCGFHRVSENFMLDNIPHVRVIRDPGTGKGAGT